MSESEIIKSLKEKINYLNAKVNVLEKENDVLSEKAEQTFLINIIMEELQHIENIDLLTESFLERISILTAIPFCAYYESENSNFKLKKYYISFTQLMLPEHSIQFNEEETKELNHGYMVINLKERLGNFLNKFSCFKDRYFGNVLIISTINAEGKHAIFLFAVENEEISKLENNLMLLNHAVDIYHEFVAKLKLEKDLIKLNNKLEKLVEERTENLRITEEKFKQLFDYAGDGNFLWEIDKDKLEIVKCLEVNNQACVQLGYSKEELVGLTPFDFTSENSNHRLKELLKNIINNERLTFESEHVKKDGQKFPVEITSRYFKLGKNDVLLSVVRDISERKKAEQEKEKYKLELQQVHKMEALGTLAGGIAHDFNNLLAGIYGSASLLRIKDKFDEEYYNLLENIDSCVKNSKDLIKQILLFSRKNESEIKIYNLNSLIENSLKLIKSSLPSSIKIIFQKYEKDLFVKIDESSINQILMNLCVNAAYAMDYKGEINIEIGFDDLKDLAYFTVSDKGKGIKSDILNRIFDPFYTTKPVGKGTGMGLSVVHGLVDKLNGKIKVKSEENIGTTFKIFLPLEEKVISEKLIENEQKKQKEFNIEDMSVDNVEVLVIDDNEIVLEVEAAMLNELGFKTHKFTSPLKGIEFYKNNKEKIKLIFTDFTMPEINGMELISELKKIKNNILTVLCSGLGETFDKDKLEKSGIDLLLSKPLKLKDITKVIDLLN